MYPVELPSLSMTLCVVMGCTRRLVLFFLFITYLLSFSSKICSLPIRVTWYYSSWTPVYNKAQLQRDVFWRKLSQEKYVTFVKSMVIIVITKVPTTNIHIFCFIVCNTVKTFIFIYITLTNMLFAYCIRKETEAWRD